MLEAQERTDLTNLLAGLPNFSDSVTARQVLLIAASLGTFVGAMDLSGPPDVVASDLLSQIEEYGSIAERPGYHCCRESVSGIC